MPRLLETTVHMSKDSIWPWMVYAEPGEPWPADSPAHTRFLNSAGGQIADIPATAVSEQAIQFLAQPAEVNDIPAGAQFETFIETDDGPLKIRYGTVIRPQARTFNAPGISSAARKFEDTFQRTRLGNNWEPVTGSTRIYNNSLQSLAYGVGPNVALFLNFASAIRWKEQTLGDTVKVSFTIVMPTAFGATNGKTAAVLCASHNFSSGLALEVDSVNNQLHMARITAPNTLAYVGSAIANTPASNDSYSVIYNNLTDTLSVFKGSSATPLGEWPDTTDLVPHGNGYRHVGFMFKPTLLETGPQVSGWAAKDDV